jgi:hypothetical protein
MGAALVQCERGGERIGGGGVLHEWRGCRRQARLSWSGPDCTSGPAVWLARKKEEENGLRRTGPGN